MLRLTCLVTFFRCKFFLSSKATWCINKLKSKQNHTKREMQIKQCTPRNRQLHWESEAKLRATKVICVTVTVRVFQKKQMTWRETKRNEQPIKSCKLNQQFSNKSIMTRHVRLDVWLLVLSVNSRNIPVSQVYIQYIYTPTETDYWFHRVRTPLG